MTSLALERRIATLEAQILPQPQVEVPDACTLFTRAIGPPDAWQAEVLTSTAPRLSMNCCRQSGKSETVACLALHTALATPNSLILLVSSSLRQSQELFKKVVVAWRVLGYPMSLEAQSSLRYELRNGSRLIALPATEGTVRGYSGVDLLVIDEAARVDDSLYMACRPMTAVSGGRIVTLSTPFGKRGWWFREWSSGEGWQRTLVKAYDCPRIPPAFLEEEFRTLPNLWFQ
jgi:hypothetical protein